MENKYAYVIYKEDNNFTNPIAAFDDKHKAYDYKDFMQEESNKLDTRPNLSYYIEIIPLNPIY